MKKKFLLLSILPLTILLGGCSVNYNQIAKENMSEITDAYFYGKCDEFEISLSSGQRENPYVYDGKHNESCDFALVVMNLNSKNDKESVVFSIDGSAQSCVVEFNPITGTFMADLEKKLTQDDNVSVKFGNTQITLDCLSKDFKVDVDRAIEIGVSEFQENIENMFEKDNFKAECYLKVLDNLSNGYDKCFWCFSVVDANQNHYNVIIDTENGNILAKT